MHLLLATLTAFTRASAYAASPLGVFISMYQKNVNDVLVLEQLTIRIFSFLPKWRRTRLRGRSSFHSITRSVVKNMSFSWNGMDHRPPVVFDRNEALKICCEIMKQPPVLKFLYPPTSVMTPIGPIPGELRDKIVLAMDPATDDLRNRESWLRTIKRMDAR